jgi:hypothetical protein
MKGLFEGFSPRATGGFPLHAGRPFSKTYAIQDFKKLKSL